MLTVLLGLSTALVYGAADFFGGVAAKRISPLRVTAISAVIGFVGLLIAHSFIGGQWTTEATVIGIICGVTGPVAIVLLYASLAIGPMSILSPLTALISAIVPLTIGLVRDEQLAPIGYVALVIALVAVVLVGFVPEKEAVRPSLRGILFAVGSGVAIGLFLVLLDLAPQASGLIPLVLARAVAAVLLFAAIGALVLIGRQRATASTARSRPGVQPAVPLTSWRSVAWLIVGCGVLDAAANVGVLLGVRLGDLSVVAVLTAMYPAGTIILAAIVLRERIAKVQYAGIALAIVAAAMLALA